MSKSLDNYLDVSVDIKDLGVLPDRAKLDPVVDSMSDSAYLDKQRVLAETSLIKSTIIYKCHHNLPLSELEKQYSRDWLNKSRESKSLVSSNVMVPASPAAVRIDSLSPEDFYALNNIPGVEFNRDMHGAYALNELVVELSQLIDRDTIRKVELKMLEGRLKHEFSLGHSFSLVDKRNKEIDLVHQELEEVQWRKAAKLEEKEKSAIKEMLSIGRGVDKFD